MRQSRHDAPHCGLPRAADNTISPSKHGQKVSLRDEGWKGGGGGGGGGADAQGERRLEESLNKETVEIRAQKTRKRSSERPPGFWGLGVGIMSGAKHIQPH